MEPQLVPYLIRNSYIAHNREKIIEFYFLYVGQQT